MNKYWRWKVTRFIAELGVLTCIVILMAQGQVLLGFILGGLMCLEILASIKVDDHRALYVPKTKPSREIA